MNFLRTHNSILRTPNLILKTIIFGLLITISQLLTPNSELYSQTEDDYLEAKGDAKADTLTFSGDRADFPSTPVKGELFYNSTDKSPYHFNGTEWKTIGGSGVTDKYVATKIVAASDSLNIYRADYVCDGTDDQQEISLAIAALPAGGGAVYLLEGTYNISGPINITNSNVSLNGAGSASILRWLAGIDIITVTNANNVLLSRFTIDGNNSLNFRGVYLQCASGVNIEKVFFRNTSSSANNAIQARCCSDINITRNNFESAVSGSVIQLLNGINSIISGNNFGAEAGSNYDGISLGGELVNCATVCSGPPLSTIVEATNNVVSNNTLYRGGIDLFNYASGNIASYNHFLNDTSNAINVWSPDNVVSGNVVRSSGSAGISVRGEGGYSGNRNVISGNFLGSNGRYGLSMQTGSQNMVFGNVIVDNGGPDNYSGIRLYAGSDNNLISGNRISDSAGGGSNYGIDLQSADCDNNYAVGNLISGAGFARPINDAGTNTRYTDKLKMTMERVTFPGAALNPVTTPLTYAYYNGPNNIILTLAATTNQAPGSLLIIENGTAARTVTVNDGATIDVQSGSRVLNQYGTLRLIWNGTRWLEIGYANN